MLARISPPLPPPVHPVRINVIPGTTVTVIDPRDEVLGFADREVTQALCYSMRKNGARFLLGEKASEPLPDPPFCGVKIVRPGRPPPNDAVSCLAQGWISTLFYT